MLAAIENHGEVVQALASAGADLDKASYDIKTPEVKRDKNVAVDAARGSFPKARESSRPCPPVRIEKST